MVNTNAWSAGRFDSITFTFDSTRSQAKLFMFAVVVCSLGGSKSLGNVSAVRAVRSTPSTDQEIVSLFDV